MKSFTLNGVKYKNGYACNGRGVPITMNSGYSSEDEREARQAYEEALAQLEKGAMPSSKISEKLILDGSELSKEDWEAYEKAMKEDNSKYSENGYLLSDSGQEISVENGYSDSDVHSTSNDRCF